MSEPRFVVFVIPADGPIEWIELGPAAPIEEAIGRWRGEDDDDFGETDAARAAARDLRELVWEPIEPHLADAQTILISPDGALARFPLAALPGKEPGTVLLEERAIAVVPVPQLLPELFAPRDVLESADAALLAIGNVDFDAATQATEPLPSQQLLAATGRTSRSALRDGTEIQFPALPATASEIDSIQDVFRKTRARASVATLRGAAATEAAFKQHAPGKRYIHVATHGFFATGRFAKSLAGERDAPGGALPISTDLSDPLGGRITGPLFHPGLLSGLAFAGANRKLEPPEDPLAPLPDDGILTALEVAELDLRGTELVVLSACDTGLGKVAGGEGVLGLQRAFQVAGVRNTIVSLWKVDDESTAALMKLFYQKLWREKKPRAVALREAQLFIYRHPDQIGKLARSRGPDLTKEVDLIETQSKNAGTKTAPPRHWAAFVLAGAGQ